MDLLGLFRQQFDLDSVITHKKKTENRDFLKGATQTQIDLLQKIEEGKKRADCLQSLLTTPLQKTP